MKNNNLFIFTVKMVGMGLILAYCLGVVFFATTATLWAILWYSPTLILGVVIVVVSNYLMWRLGSRKTRGLDDRGSHSATAKQGEEPSLLPASPKKDTCDTALVEEDHEVTIEPNEGENAAEDVSVDEDCYTAEFIGDRPSKLSIEERAARFHIKILERRREKYPLIEDQTIRSAPLIITGAKKVIISTLLAIMGIIIGIIVRLPFLVVFSIGYIIWLHSKLFLLKRDYESGKRSAFTELVENGYCLVEGDPRVAAYRDGPDYCRDCRYREKCPFGAKYADVDEIRCRLIDDLEKLFDAQKDALLPADQNTKDLSCLLIADRYLEHLMLENVFSSDEITNIVAIQLAERSDLECSLVDVLGGDHMGFVVYKNGRILACINDYGGDALGSFDIKDSRCKLLRNYNHHLNVYASYCEVDGETRLVNAAPFYVFSTDKVYCHATEMERAIQFLRK